MSLSDLDVKAKYSANGVTTAFSIPFAHISNDSAETVVYLVDESVDPPTETLQTEGALQDYTLTGASPPGTPFDTHVTFNSAPTSGLKVLVIRVLAITQPTDLDASQNVNLTTIETAIDRATALLQQLNEAIERAPKFRKSYTAVTNPVLPDPSANMFLKWNEDGDGLTNAQPVTNVDAGEIGVPASSTDNAIVRWDGTDASTVQDSGATVSDAGVISAAGLLATGLTASRAVVTDGSKNLASSATTATEVGYLSGVTSAIQTQLNSKASQTDLDTVESDLDVVEALVSGTTNSELLSTAGNKAGIASISNSQSGTNITGMTIDATPATGYALESGLFFYEITRGTPATLMRVGVLAVRFISSTWEIEDVFGSFDSLAACGISFGITTASDVGQVTYTSGAEGAGTIKWKRMGMAGVV